jgi:hypothetical protein
MAENDLFNYMREATRQMQSEYERIQKRASDDPGTAGDTGEENWAQLLRRWLPKHYTIVTKGRIMNAQGECSPQVDILVLSSSYPQALIEKKEYLAGGVLAAFECKLTLKANHIQEAVKTAAKIHRLCANNNREGTPYKELFSPIYYGLLAHSHNWKANNSSPIKNIEKHLHESEENEVRHPNELMNIVCVSNLATWGMMKVIFAGKNHLSQVESSYKNDTTTWLEIQNSGGVIQTAHMCSPFNQTKDKPVYPISVLITSLFEYFSREDISLRPFTAYFYAVGMSGVAEGLGRSWTLSIFSEELRNKLKQGNYLQTGRKWSEWDMVFH